jgi:hypothetical protein
MQRSHLRSLAVALGLTAPLASLSANPLPLVSLPGPINSRGLINDPNNAVIVTPALPAGGPFTYLTISGTLTEVNTSTYASEACIEVTTPSGQQFVVKPFALQDFVGTTAVPAGSVTVPLNGNFGVGACTLRFFELFRDNASGADATWSNVFITLHNADGGDITPLNATITPTTNGPDVSGNGAIYTVLSGTPASVALAHPTPGIVNQVRIRGYGTGRSGYGINSSDSQLAGMTLNITAPRADVPGATATWTVQPFPTSAASSSQCDVVVNTPYPVLTGPGHDWSWSVTSNAPAPAASSPGAVWMSFQPLAPVAAVTPVSCSRSIDSYFTGQLDQFDRVNQGAASHHSDVEGNLVTFNMTADGTNGYAYTTLGYVFNVPPGGCTFQLSGSGVLHDLQVVAEAEAHITLTGPGVNIASPASAGNGVLTPYNFSGTFPAAGGQYTLNIGSNASRGVTGGQIFSSHSSITGALVISGPSAPAAVDLGVVRSRPALGPEESTVVKTLTSAETAGSVQWYTFSTEQPCSDASGYWLDIHTQIPAGSPVTDHMIGVYDPPGNLVSYNDDGGSGNRSQLSFGRTSPVRAAVDPTGSPHARDGFSGPLTAGLHYLAVTQYSATFAGAGWNVVSTGAQAGNIGVEFRTNLPPLIPPFTDLGTLQASHPAFIQVYTPPGEVRWFRFDLAGNINSITHYYLDIDTIEPGAPLNDTELGLFNSRGVLLASDDDDGVTGNRSQLSFGAGQVTRAPIGGSFPGNGRDGDLPVGRYYLATGLYDTAFANEWSATSIAPTPGSYTVNFRSNLPPPPCGPADLGGQGGLNGSDGVLDNNDFVVFIDYFFTQNPTADVGSQGGVPGPDGAFDNNDFIVFIDLFFIGC